MNANSTAPLKSHKKRIVFVRHGETDFNAEKRVQGQGINTNLNELGRAQALQVASRLKNETFDLVACSTLTRAVETAEIIISNHVQKEKYVLEKYDELKEMAYGIFEGKLYVKPDPSNPKYQNEECVVDDLDAVIHQWNDGHTDVRFPNGESPQDVEQRGLKILNQILSRDGIEHVLVVTHGRFLRVMLCSLLGYGLNNMMKVRQDNTAVNVLEYDCETHTYHPVLINCTAHLCSPSAETKN